MTIAPEIKTAGIIDRSNPGRKAAGRANYNMAIIIEINGDIETAVDRAEKAYADYRIKPGRSYARFLKNRIYNRKLLEYQEQR